MKQLLIAFLLLTTNIWSDNHLEVTSRHNGNGYTLQSGDVAFSGDAIQFTFSAVTNGTLKIFHDNNGSKEELYSKNISANHLYTFSDSQELILDNTVGMEHFIFELDEKIVKKFSLMHLDKKINTKTKQRTHKDNTTSQNKNEAFVKNLLKYTPLETRAYTDMTKIKTKTRSATDKRIYRELSSPTVVIQANNEMGTGLVVSKKGKILTSWHVVKDLPYVSVAFKPVIGNTPAKNNYYTARVVKKDKTRDLALLHLNDTSTVQKRNIKLIPFFDIEKIEVGEDIYTMGHPVGYYFSFGNGTISNILNDHKWQAKGIQHKANYILKTQNTISSGNSGGPIVNKDMKLLGIVAYSDTKGQNLNFGISIKDIKDFLHTTEQIDITPESIVKNNISETNMKNKPKKQSNFGEIINVLDPQGNTMQLKKIDSNNNGIPDIMFLDTNNNGEWDRIYYDKDEDGVVDRWSNL